MNTNHQPVLNSITLIVDTFFSQSRNYDSVSLVDNILKWNISHLELIKLDIPVLSVDVDLAIADLRRIASKTVDRLTRQLVAAVEREAFPRSDYCLTCQQHIDDAAFCNHPHCSDDVKPNSGDSARLPATAVEREAFLGLADVGRSSVQSAEVVGQESNCVSDECEERPRSGIDN